MSSLASLNVKIDRTVKTEADTIANAMGMTLSTAINIFVRQMVSERAIPFRVQMTGVEANEFERIKQKRLSAKGSLKGKVWMTDDFDAPLEDMLVE